MAKLTLIWTALPNGRNSTQKLKLSVFVSPRLQLDHPTGKLEAFPDIVNWPSRVGSGRFSIDVIIDDDVAYPVRAEIVTKPAIEPALWAALFDRNTFVRTYVFPMQQEPVSSYDADAMQRNLYHGFGEVGESTPYRLPDTTTLKRAFPHVFDALAPPCPPEDFNSTEDVATMSPDQLAVEHAELAGQLLSTDERTSFDTKLARAIAIAGALARQPDAKAVPIIPRTDSEVSAIAQFVAFHRRPARRRANPASRSPQDADADRIDFHQALTALGEYPDLLRRLGLVLDLEITGRIPDSLFGDAALKRLRVEPKFADGALANTPYTPNTKYLLDLRLTGSPWPWPIFAAAPRRAEAQHAVPFRDPEIVGGLLNLGMPGPAGRAQFSLVQTDIDGAMTKVLNTVNAIVLDEQRPTHPIDKPDATGAPAFRSSGLSLVRSDHADALIEGIQRANAHERALQGQSRADFFAEDLVRGYRIDVRRFPGNAQFSAGEPLAPPPPWLSLHRRVGRYVARPGGRGSVTLQNIADEGFIQPAFVQDPDAGTPAAPPTNPIYVPESMFHWKGWSLSAPPPANPVTVTPPSTLAEEIAPTGVPQLDVDVTPLPGSQPRLRFGSFYEVRARIVDLAGNGPSIEDADRIVAALEAQGSPTPVLSDRPGKFRYRRFEPIPPPEPVLREVLTAGETVDVMVIRSNGSTAAAYAASLGDPRYKGVSERHIVPPKAALTTVETHGKLDAALGLSGNPGTFYNLCRRESGTLNDNGIINLATGNREPFPNVTVPNPSGGTTQVPNGIRFVEVPPGPGGYTVHCEAQLRVTYLPDPMARGAALFGLPGVRGVSGQLEGAVLKYSTPEGQVLAIPAARDLGFVTKIDFGAGDKWPDIQPFRLKLDELASDVVPVRPQWSNGARELTVKLAPGQTQTIWISSYPAPEDVDLFGLYAWWSSQAAPSSDEKHFLKMAPHGALSMLSPPRKLVLVHAVQRPVKPPIESRNNRLKATRFANSTTAYIGGEFEIHSASTAKLDLLAEWGEQSEARDEHVTVKSHVFEVAVPPPRAASAAVMPIAKLDSNNLTFLAPNGSTVPAERYLARHEFGDTKYRRVTYRLVATTRFREFFPDTITANPENLTQISSNKIVHVASSARPPAPDISYIVPSFGWIVDKDSTRIRESVRRGGGLRVYLGERWYASGAGEQLAVVEVAGLNRSGLDPVHISNGAATASPITPDMPAATAPGLSFDGQIHPYEVRFDPDLRLWYSDISFQVRDNYFPFRQIALARYQPNSLPGLHVSSVVYAGIYQLAPDRAVMLQYPTGTPSGPRRVDIAVTARPTTALESVATEPNGAPIIEVVLEERDLAHKNWDPDLDWKPAASNQQPVLDQAPTQSQLWKGHVLLPREPGGKQRRLVVREVEVFRSRRNPLGQAWLNEPEDAARRVVYADTIPLD